MFLNFKRLYIFVISWHYFALANDQTEPKVVDLTVEKFEKEVPQKPHFILFFAPWCGHCQRLKPVWDELGKKYNKESEVVTIAQVDCTVHTIVCASQGVNGYPTLRFYAKGIESSVKFRANRDLQSLENFIADQLGLESESNEGHPEPIAGLVEFTDQNLEAALTRGKVFIKFYAPWCGHCKRLEPTWSALAKSFEHDPSVVIGRFDCTKYRTMCSEFEVKGYPTLLWIENGKTTARYSGSRSYEDLKRFVVEQLGELSDVEEDPLKDDSAQTVVKLTAENFENTIADGATFVMFFAPWCGHCKRIAPTYEELGGKFLGEQDVVIAKVDCTSALNAQLCADQQVTGFPTFFLYKDGNKEAQYDGRPELEKMVDFIMANLIRDEL